MLSDPYQVVHENGGQVYRFSTREAAWKVHATHPNTTKLYDRDGKDISAIRLEDTETFSPLETTNPKAAIGAAKAPFFGIPSSALIWMGNVMAGGAHKYGIFNYRKTRIATSTYNDAILRHLYLYMDGEDTDPESGAPHLAHIMACCALLLDAQTLGKCEDDRSKTGLVRPMLGLSAEKLNKFKETHNV